jgi:hypothetical protein
MTRYFESPAPVPPHILSTAPSVFLAGGITGAPDWQAYATNQLVIGHDTMIIVNPRRANFPMGDPAAGRDQILWEQRYLHAVHTTLFWFPDARPHPTVQPIALLELGQALGEGRRIVVGADPGYVRFADVLIQCEINRPTLTVHTTIDDVIAEVLAGL